jgi:hypothetical protein
MDGIGIGGGLSAVGFWLFLASVVAMGIWDGSRKREAQHETLRRMIESGQALDDALVDRLLAGSGSQRHPDRDMRLGGVIVLAVAVGLVLFGWVMSATLDDAEDLLYVMLAVGALLVCIGGGMLLAARMMVRWQDEDG